MAKIETYDLSKFQFSVSAEGDLYVDTDYVISNISGVFYYEESTGNLYFTDVMPWQGLYWELLPNGNYRRVNGSFSGDFVHVD